MKASTFDFYKMAAGTTTPEDTVDIYLDADTAYRAAKVEDKLNSPSATVGPLKRWKNTKLVPRRLKTS